MFAAFERLIDPFRAHDETMPPTTIVAFYLRYCRQISPLIAALTALGLVISLIEASILAFSGTLIDMLRASPPAEVFARQRLTFIGMAALVLIVRPLASFTHDLLTQQAVAPGFTNLIRWQTHRWTLRQSMGYFANDFAGRIASNIVQSAPALRESMVQIVDSLWFVTTFAATTLVIFARADLRLAVPLVLWVAYYLAVLSVLVPRIRRRSEQLAHARADLTGHIVDAYSNIQTVKLFSRIEREDADAREALSFHLAAFRRQTRLITWLNLFVSLGNSLVIVVEGGLSVWLWSRGALTLGDIAIAITLTVRVVTMSGWVMWMAIGIFDSIGQVQEGMRTVAKPRLVDDAPAAQPLAAPRGDIRFDNVSFHYGKGSGVIDGLSLHIASGEKVGLVGRSGSGKSTLVNLLLRFYDVEAGRILVDGQDIAGVRQESLRRRIGMVTQDTSLLNRTIAENILYGRPDASREEMIAAARAAHADAFIAGLIDAEGRAGYDTMVGERGVKLSGGQRQRIAIARVMLKDAPILVLDEATSALDSEIEQAIQENLQALMAGKTVIAIAHRLSTIAAMDRLVVLDGGRVVEMGSHRDLIARDGLYAALWRRQSGGFLKAAE
ncbi:MAG TPA: ABC transporter ATP-binding protein [Roseiarcus sp.]|nr:ABC transporter ATP-binding protein [Roseiarcus sp.]